jgi:hypothetical protein
VMQRGQHPLGIFPRQFGYPLSFRRQVCGTQSSLPCFSSMGLNAWRLPSLQRVLVSPVPRLPRYYEAPTTSHRACPSAYGFASGFHMSWRFVFAPALPMPAKSVIGPGAFKAGCSCRLPMWTQAGALRFPGGPSRTFALLQDPGRTEKPDHSGFPMLPPHPTRRRLRRSHDFEANHRASVPAVYASRVTLPSPMQDSLPAGGLRLCREGVEPSGSR